ncbi:MAG: MBOAT family O-acyltransferase [Bacilli bacterium]|nr:MBOAT family O-acyltransferase [Bacilli bacterium]
MIFSSIPFLFFFFPLFILLYFTLPFKYKNYILLLFSLIFYAWGEPIYILLMIFSSIVDFINGKNIEKYKDDNKKKKFYLIISIIINISLLGFFKYADFFIKVINNILNLDIPLLNLGLPIGISFFTFQTMSYSIDVYRGDVKAEKDFLTFMTYVCMFPQLIAGPIVRYETVSSELHKRDINFKKFADGFTRFLRGLFKKVLIANNIGLLFTLITSSEVNDISIMTGVLAIVSYAFQIYFDFSGYSDMAIGMGNMCGFTFLENFNYPYISKSITEFWRRWHISLSSWFKDYVYIPLGGSRVNILKNIRNILIVWILTGFWHGASWNFIFWGLYYGILLLLEKFVLKKYIDKLPDFVKHIYTIVLVFIGWMIFAFDDSKYLFEFIKALTSNKFVDSAFLYYFKNYFLILVTATLFSLPVYPKVKEKVNNSIFTSLLSISIYVILFIITLSYLVSDTYNPFLYFRF